MHVTVATLPLLGHALPAAKVVRALVRRGHTVTWATGAAAKKLATGAGATFHPLPFPGWTPAATIQDAAQRFLDWAPDQQTACADLPEGPILADPTMLGVHRHAAATGQTLFVLGILPFLGKPAEASAVIQATIHDMEPWLLWKDQPVAFVGPILIESPWKEPKWWKEMLAARHPRVLLTQGTLATDPEELIRPALAGLEGAGLTPYALCDPAVAPDAYCAKWLDFGRALTFADCLVTNGGYGAIQHAMALGVPVVVAGTTDDKALNGGRVEYSGLGLTLAPPFTPERIRLAVQTVLATPRFKERANELSGRCPAGKAEERIATMITTQQRKAA